jgi:transcriptional regulator with XRE-family HTH domain
MDADKNAKAAEHQALADRFAKTLVELREEAELSQEELGLRAGVHRTQVSLMEGGQRLPRFTTLARVAGALGVEPGALFAGIKFKPPEEIIGGFEITD